MATKEKLEEKMKGKTKHIGCLCCDGSEDILEMETKLYNGFGGWSISKDGEQIEIENSNPDNWDELTELKDIEKLAQLEPKKKWIAFLFLPLREATYERADCGQWVLIKTGMGFA